MTVAGRLELARDHIKSISTEIIPVSDQVVVKVVIVTDKGTFTGISAANPSNEIVKAEGINKP